MYKKMGVAEWLNFKYGAQFPIDKNGTIIYKLCDKKLYDEYIQLSEKHEEEYRRELKEYNLFEKNNKISLALAVLKKHGIDAKLMSRQNGHIQVKSKRGIIYNYYAGTGTIAGYYNTNISGLDWLLHLCFDVG